MNTLQILSEIQVISNSPEGQVIVGMITGNLTAQAQAKVDGDLTAYLQANPNVTPNETVTTVMGREFHNLRVKLGWFGFLVDGLANDSQVTTKVVAYIKSRIQAAINAGKILVNPQTGNYSLAPSKPTPPPQQPGNQGNASNTTTGQSSA